MSWSYVALKAHMFKLPTSRWISSVKHHLRSALKILTQDFDSKFWQSAASKHRFRASTALNWHSSSQNSSKHMHKSYWNIHASYNVF